MQEKEFANPVQTLRATSLQNPAQEPYTAPHIEVTDIELEQNILGGSTEDIPGGGFW